jgi:hypothetical protein
MEAARPAIFLREWRRGDAPGDRGDPGLKHEGGQDLRGGTGGLGREGGDGQHHCRICPGRRWWPCQVVEGLVSEGNSEGDGGPEEKEMPGCRGPGTAGEEVEDGLRGCLRLAGRESR